MRVYETEVEKTVDLPSLLDYGAYALYMVRPILFYYMKCEYYALFKTWRIKTYRIKMES